MSADNLTLRQRKILHFLQNHTGFITGSELSKPLEVSSKTIRTDISEINQQLNHSDIRIVSEHSKGYYLDAGNPAALAELNKIDRVFLTKEDRVRFLTLRLCLADSPLDLYDLEDEMYVSRTTLDHDLHQLKRQHVMSPPHIQLFQSRDQIWFEADERKRRDILNQLFHKDWDYNNKGNAYYGYDFLDERMLDLITSEVSDHLKQQGLQMEDTNLVTLNLAIALMYHRLANGHGLPADQPAARSNAAADRACEVMLDSLESILKTSFPPHERDRIYEIIAAGHLMDASLLNFKTVAEYFEPDVLQMAHEYLEHIKDIFGINLSEDEDFYITLLQYIRCLKIPGHIFNDQENPDLIRSNLLIEYELACLFQPLALKYLGSYPDRTELLYLALCLSGAIEFLSTQHPEQKLKTVICSHLNLPATWALKRKVLGAFGNYLEITALLPVNAKSSFSFEDTDLVLTTVRKPITCHEDTTTIRISSYMAPNDYLNIECYISSMRFLRICPAHVPAFPHLLRTAYWHTGLGSHSPVSLIELMAGDFLREGIVSPSFPEEILHRESISGFALKPGILLLYSLSPSKKTQLGVALMEHRLLWKSHKIRLIIMACFTREDVNLIFRLLQTLYQEHYSEEEIRNLRTREEVEEYYSVKNIK